MKIDTFSLTSSSEVDGVVGKLEYNDAKILIHIVSFIHNTVLAQSLKLKLGKKFPNAKIVFIKHNDKSKTLLIIYTLQKTFKEELLTHEILNNIKDKYEESQHNLDICRKQLVNGYFTDNLTNLPNIYQLRKNMEDNQKCGLITIALDDFITINNFYGFMVGDYVIEKISQILTEKIDYEIYRISGTEFAIYLKENLNFYQLKEYLGKLYDELKNLTIDYQEHKISVSFTLASCANTNQTKLFSKVSMALKYAKDKRLPFWIYENRMGFEDEYEKNLNISNMIRKAVQSSNIVPYFQPIIDNKTDKIKKYECLARLLDENGSVIPPMLFIPTSKKIKVYNLITKIIVEKSFKVFEKNDLEFSINLSMEDITNSDIYDFIIQTLQSSTASNRVTFEIVESETIQDFEKITRFIKEIRRYGAKIAIDDFGSGYSNFSYLIKMDVDFLKIDGTLISNIDKNKNSRIIVETIVEFANKLNIKTVAEFVHSSSVMGMVKKLNIDYSQGYHIDEPLLSIK